MASNKIYWKTTDQLDSKNENLKKLEQNEFVSKLPEDFLSDEKMLEDSSASRRDFLKYVGFSTTAAALAAQWSNSSPLQLSATLGINVTSASAPVVTTQTRIQNVTVSTMTVVDCPPGFWGANGECVECAKGTYRSGQGNATGCLECPAGTYQPSDGGSECLVCGNKLAP